MKHTLVLPLILIVLTSCHEAPDIAAHKRLENLAGKDAFDCGRATTTDEYSHQSACALDHLNRKTPFFVQYRVVGIDAISEEGLALDSKGKLTGVGTFSWGPAAPVGKFEITSCDPKKLHEISSGYLVCY